MRADPVQLPVVSVVASADDGNVAANTVDKNMATRWSAQGDGQWIRFDLGASLTMGSAKIAWYQGNQRIAKYDVQTSADGSSWTTVFSGVSSGTTTGLEPCNMSSSTGRYLRIVGHGNSVNLWNSICEVEIYGTSGTVTQPPPPSGASLLTVRGVAASSYDSANVPANAIDKNLSTRWSAFGEGQWIAFELGSRATLTTARIAWYKGVQRVTEFDVQTSDDAANWKTVYSGASSGTTLALESYDVSDSAGKYVRIVGYGNSSSLWTSIAEVELYGVADTGSTPPPPTTTLPTVTVAASDANASETGAGTGTFTISRTGATTAGLTVRYSLAGTAGNGTDYGSLSGSLTIPAGAASATVTVTPIDDTTVDANETVTLTLSANSAYTVGSPNTATVTIADNDQAPTNTTLPSGVLNLTNWKLTLPVDTSHAGSPDEILQPELNTFQDAKYFHVNSTRNGVVFNAPCGGATTSGSGYPRSELREMSNNGSTQASWSTTSGTHTMEITQAITHLPVVKPHVVAGQIHNAADDVIVFRLEGTKLFIDENGNNGPVLTTNYQLGTVFTVKFVARNGGVECYYNGQFIYKYSVSTSGCYFKAGCYTQSNTSKGDAPTAYGEVVIYGVTVTHQ